jgi:hypothetical protein
MEFKVKLGNGLSHTLMAENTEQKLNQNVESLKVQYLGLFFSSYISMICPQSSILSPSLY